MSNRLKRKDKDEKKPKGAMLLIRLGRRVSNSEMETYVQ
jgi:hypothetical protein